MHRQARHHAVQLFFSDRIKIRKGGPVADCVVVEEVELNWSNSTQNDGEIGRNQAYVIAMHQPPVGIFDLIDILRFLLFTKASKDARNEEI